MNKRSLSFLIALNVTLLAALVLTVLTPEPAEAQFGGGSQYLMIAGRSAERQQQAAIYVIDLRTTRIVSLFVNTSNNTWQPVAGTSVRDDVGGGRDGGGRSGPRPR